MANNSVDLNVGLLIISGTRSRKIIIKRINKGSLHAQEQAAISGFESRAQSEHIMAKNSEPEYFNINNPDKKIIRPNDIVLINRTARKSLTPHNLKQAIDIGYNGGHIIRSEPSCFENE